LRQAHFTAGHGAMLGTRLRWLIYVTVSTKPIAIYYYYVLQIDHYYIIILTWTGLNGRNDKAHSQTADGIRVQPVVCVSRQSKRNRSMQSSVYYYYYYYYGCWRRADWMMSLSYNLSPGNSPPKRLIKLSMTMIVVEAVMAAMAIAIKERFCVLLFFFFLLLLFLSAHLLSRCISRWSGVALSRIERKQK